jgi:putative addiction module killer protein
VNTIKQTAEFTAWLKGLKDLAGKAKIIIRLKRAASGNFGDCKHFDGITEMRIDTGPGYRVYLARKGDTVYILLNGGNKKSQEADIKKAKTLWAKLES